MNKTLPKPKNRFEPAFSIALGDCVILTATTLFNPLRRIALLIIHFTISFLFRGIEETLSCETSEPPSVNLLKSVQSTDEHNSSAIDSEFPNRYTVTH